MNRERLSIYIWCAAAYEMIVFLWFRIREGGAPPLLLDPRGPLQWMFASVPTNESIMLSLVSAAWLIGIGFGIRVAPKLLWVYAILETCLALTCSPLSAQS